MTTRRQRQLQKVNTLYGKTARSDYDDFNNLTSYRAPGRDERTVYNWGATDAEKQKHAIKDIPRVLSTFCSKNKKGQPKLTN